jgi:hypothetical protein
MKGGWIEKRVEWKYPRDDTGRTYPQPSKGAPYTLFAACILPGCRETDVKISAIPRGYCVYLSMCNHYTTMAAESVHKRRNTVLKNTIKKKAAGMPRFMWSEIERIEREKKDASYFDLQTCVETQIFRQQAVREMKDRWSKELLESINKLDNHPELKVEVAA